MENQTNTQSWCYFACETQKKKKKSEKLTMVLKEKELKVDIG